MLLCSIWKETLRPGISLHEGWSGKRIWTLSHAVIESIFGVLHTDQSVF